ncbi:MAG: hypothetical protein OEW59_02925 [Gammaproteobacteria bacterium]|nr:hypothetical protein [Gammaproteobacteria bacterium]
MSKQTDVSRHTWQPRVSAAILVLALIVVAGCSSPGGGEGKVISTIDLETDTLLNLNCESVGVFPDPCVLNDPENPFRTATIREFNVNEPDAETKFDLANQIPPGPTGAKSRFYLWATALARFPSGENQWYTARALHELWDAAGDPIVQTQALKAYRSVLDNFFGSVTFFECCAIIDPDNQPVPFSVPLNELTADNLYRTESTGWARLVPGDPLLTQSLLSEWGYSYQPATAPDFNDGVVTVNEF